MSEEDVYGLSEDDLFTILSHPIRRKILREMFSTGQVTFTKLSKDWGIATGTIYHHLKALETLIHQNEQNHYILTDEGLRVCEWFLRDGSTRVKIQQIDTITSLSYPIIDFVKDNEIVVFRFTLLIISIGIVLAASTELTTFGPLFFVGANQKLFFVRVVLNSLLSAVSLLIFLGIDWFITRGTFTRDKPLPFLVGSSFLTVSIIIIWLLTLVTSSIPWSLLLVLNTLNQLVFLILLSSYLVLVRYYKVERSVLIGLATLYSNVILASLLL